MEPNWFQPIDSLVGEIKGAAEWLKDEIVAVLLFTALAIAIVLATR